MRLAPLRAAGNDYIELWATYGSSPSARAAASVREHGEVVYNAARAFQAARLIAKAIQARLILIKARQHDGQNQSREEKLSTRLAGNDPAIARLRRGGQGGPMTTPRANPRGEKLGQALSTRPSYVSVSPEE